MGTHERRRGSTARRQPPASTGAASSAGRSSGRFRRPDPAELERLIDRTVMLLGTGTGSFEPPELEHLLRIDAEASSPGVPDVSAQVFDRLLASVGLLFANGWQPVDLVRHCRRWLDAKAADLMAVVVRADAVRYLEDIALHPAWRRQVDELAPSVEPSGAPSATFAAWERELGGWPGEALTTALRLLARMRVMPRIPILIPPPGCGPEVVDECLRSDPADQLGDGLDRKLLERVRALLAKAESTTFPEEADALTAKAQELMGRHSIDSAMVDGHAAGGAHRPSARRLPVDDPYASAKALLLGQITAANRATSVWVPNLGFSTVFGFEVDLDNVELLYTSLLVQATGAMVSAGSQTDGSGRSRTRAFRQSFLTSFGVRIGERLRQATDAVTEEAGRELGTALVPVLRERAEAVTQASAAVYPRARSRSTSASHGGGWLAGREAADRADLGQGTPARAPLSGR